jgi:hypothetical protein
MGKDQIEQKYKVIIKPSIARQLLHKGNPIFDIKPHKDDKNRTVFVFKINEKFWNNLSELKKTKNNNS